MDAETQKDLFVSGSLVYSPINASIDGSEGEGAADARPTWSYFFHFHAVSGYKWPNNRLAPPPPGLAPPNWESLDPPLHAQDLRVLFLRSKFPKVMFLHLSVILFTGEVCLSACWDTTPYQEQTTPTGSRPPGTRHPPGPYTPWDQTPPSDEQTSPRTRHSPHPHLPPPGAVHAGRYG